MALLKYLAGYGLIFLAVFIILFGIFMFLANTILAWIIIIIGVVVGLAGRYYRAKGFRE